MRDSQDAEVIFEDDIREVVRKPRHGGSSNIGAGRDSRYR